MTTATAVSERCSVRVLSEEYGDRLERDDLPTIAYETATSERRRVRYERIDEKLWEVIRHVDRPDGEGDRVPVGREQLTEPVIHGKRVYEVGSYAYRPGGFPGKWQYHVRLTPVDGGEKTALWANRERTAWRRPVLHYEAVGWSADEGVCEVAPWYASDEWFEPSAQAQR